MGRPRQVVAAMNLNERFVNVRTAISQQVSYLDRDPVRQAKPAPVCQTVRFEEPRGYGDTQSNAEQFPRVQILRDQCERSVVLMMDAVAPAVEESDLRR